MSKLRWLLFDLKFLRLPLTFLELFQRHSWSPVRADVAHRGEERGHRQQLLHLRHQQGGHRDLPQVGHPPHYNITVSSDYCILIKGVFLRRREAGSQGLRPLLRLELRGGPWRQPDPGPEPEQVRWPGDHHHLSSVPHLQGRPPGGQCRPQHVQAGQGQVVLKGEDLDQPLQKLWACFLLIDDSEIGFIRGGLGRSNKTRLQAWHSSVKRVIRK